jgi:hypothetical protein
VHQSPVKNGEVRISGARRWATIRSELKPLGYLAVRQSVNDRVPGTFVCWLYESSSILASWLAGLSNPPQKGGGVARAAASCNSPTGQEKSCLLREPVEPRTPALAHAGQSAKRHSVSTAISGNPKSSGVSLANNPSPRIPGVSISHAHRAAPSICALSSGDVRGNRARELLVRRACFQ